MHGSRYLCLNFDFVFEKITKMNNSWSWQLLTVTMGIIITFSKATPDKETSGPILIPNRSEIVLKKGQNFTLSCKWDYPVQIKQQDIPEDDPENAFKMVLRNFSNSDGTKFEAALDLYNVNKFTVGYYACFNGTLNETDFLKDIMTEPVNTKDVAYIYIYVDDANNLLAPVREIVITRNETTILIECRPTMPDVKVSLLGKQKCNKTSEYSPKIGFLVKSRRSCSYDCQGKRGNQNQTQTIIYENVETPTPNIIIDYMNFLEGETFSINCTVIYRHSPVKLNWKVPQPIEGHIEYDSNENNLTGNILYKSITVKNATSEDAGKYTCICTNTNGELSNTTVKQYKGKTGNVAVEGHSKNRKIETEQKETSFKFRINAYPPAEHIFLRDGIELPKTKYTEIIRHSSVYIYFKNLTVNETGNYTMVARNKYATANFTYDLRVKASPVVDFEPEVDKYLIGTVTKLECNATGYPLPDINWILSDGIVEKEIHSVTHSLIKVSSYIEVLLNNSGFIICKANNSMVNHSTPPSDISVKRDFYVHEISDGFGIKNADKTWFPEGEHVILECYGSIYSFENVSWIRDDDKPIDTVNVTRSSLSIIAILEINAISLEDAGSYTCIGESIDTSKNSQTISITVAATQLPRIIVPDKDVNVEVKYLPITLSCQADGVPPPIISWHRNGERLHNSTKMNIFIDNINYTTVNSSVSITQVIDENYKYECVAESGGVHKRRSYSLIIKEKSPYKSAIYLSIIGVILFILLILVVYLMWKIRKDRQFKHELKEAGLLNFKEGATKSLNSELGIDDQAELLPYDERFEFPAEKLIFGKQIGSGAFGVVFKAEARGILNAEETTPVAVKMVKKAADNMHIKALATELKIMVHLGKHVNILNLLGACTKNIVKRELIVIVEYCKFGNIHNYMQKHREVFIDQLTDSKEKSFGKENRAFTYSTGSSGMHSDYFGSNHTQETDHTFVNTANTNRSARKVSETGYVQPDWRSNYESDYSYDGRSPRPLSSRDLLAWAFQIARGMEYLASRKVLHGDLAARNILLAEDNIVKICDFGLARSVYKNDEYKKQGNSPLPVKWLALECLNDHIFSTQSDVWSFGIVLWELFSLAKTPYPNVDPTSLIQWLKDGHRLDKPQYADDKLYDIMLRCWQQKPTMRPNFSQLQEILGSFLEDNVRNHYVDLNAACKDLNEKREGQEDYLAMVRAPDYNNLVMPSPHYVNEIRSFFPPTPTLRHDDEGYLQMSPANQTIFSPRAQNMRFDFDARRLNSSISDSGQGSELTPMLALNNLPAKSGSESDHDGNMSPYLNMCPRIEEEADEVFETNQNNLKNVQNNLNNAVTNRTYIEYDVDLKKKPQNISNNYMNINVPNGLVK